MEIRNIDSMVIGTNVHGLRIFLNLLKEIQAPRSPFPAPGSGDSFPQQVRNHINCPTDAPEPPADHEDCAIAGKTKDKGRPQKEKNLDTKRISKDRKAKKPQTTEEESCPISIGGAVEGLLEACTMRTDAGISCPAASPTM
jgi:hypothetical protein